MSRNGTFFLSVVERDRLMPSVWDPDSYRATTARQSLGEYAAVTEVRRSGHRGVSTPFRATEYRDISHRASHLTFVLEPRAKGSRAKWPAVAEQSLLFGTMRAYLGNVIVTPAAGWLGVKGPLYFPVKSEFVSVTPNDDCLYFWWAYLRSRRFLENLPLGTGGTRPRLAPSTLRGTEVAVPDYQVRRETHRALAALAEREWVACVEREMVLRRLDEG
ncbi:MAG TPA: hypothetical protein VM075_00705 [Anaerolineae bacterium]|nr:hypothetical protein [Anaerolineae bacterium]